MFTRNLQRLGALGLLLGAAGHIAVFLYLHAVFDYPQILAHSADSVLPRLAAGGARLRTAWVVYSALPLTLLLAGVASMPLLEDGGGRGLARLGAAASALAAAATMLGLMRWPSIHDLLASRWSAASHELRAVYGAMFDATNRYLGSLLAELFGELSLAAWFACVGVALRRSERPLGGNVLLAIAALVGIGALRQVTPMASPIALVGNAVVPIGLALVAGFMLEERAVAPTLPSLRGAQPRS